MPKEKEHKPSAEREVKLLLIEPKGVANMGDEQPSDRQRRMDLKDFLPR